VVILVDKHKKAIIFFILENAVDLATKSTDFSSVAPIKLNVKIQM